MDMIRKASKKDDKIKLVDKLKEIGIIHTEFTGKVLISITSGGINYIEKTEVIK